MPSRALKIAGISVSIVTLDDGTICPILNVFIIKFPFFWALPLTPAVAPAGSSLKQPTGLFFNAQPGPGFLLQSVNKRSFTFCLQDLRVNP
jgi:hypothetical protein